MNITMSSGNFNLVLSGTLSADKQADLLAKGLKYEIERTVLTDTYKAIAGVEGKRGKKVLPDRFERDSIEYNDENKAKFSTALATAMSKLGEFTISVGQYVKGETSESRKRATGLWEKSKAKGQASLDQLASLCGYEGDVEDEGAFIEAVHGWLMDTGV